MFNKNTYPFQHVSPSHHSRASTSVVDLNSAEILLHHHQDLLSGHFLAANAQVVEAGSMYNQDFCGLNGSDPSAMPRKQTVKKDRHSKIYTSQGPRDRRVRLSIGIARKFFDLQEMLGFDKPSKTLDWLLTKSKAAIKDLVQTKQNSSTAGDKSISSPSECEVVSAFDNENSLTADSKGKSVLLKNKKAKDPQQNASNLAKESRVKARARARERTREKMCIKQLIEARKTGFDLDPSIPIQYMNDQLEVCKISGSNVVIREPIFHCPLTTEDLIQESILVKRKLKHPAIFGFQQNLMIPGPSPNASENWDISNFTSQSNICASLDQHKFIDRSSNI